VCLLSPFVIYSATGEVNYIHISPTDMAIITPTKNQMRMEALKRFELALA
jgi:hypothetical protein